MRIVRYFGYYASECIYAREKSGTKAICNAATPLASRVRVCDIDIKPADVIFILSSNNQPSSSNLLLTSFCSI